MYKKSFLNNDTGLLQALRFSSQSRQNNHSGVIASWQERRRRNKSIPMVTTC
jgi:hypothetical protein